MPTYELFAKRSKTSFDIEVSFITRKDDGTVDESNSIRNVKARTGSRSERRQGIRAKSGIPLGEHWLWTYPTNGDTNLSPSGGQIGKGFYISDSKTNMLKMSDSGIDRIAIMLHPENGIPGCYAIDDSLFIYTQQGWKQAEHVTPKDKTLQYKDGRTTFAGIEDVITTDYKGELLALRTPTGNVTRVTPNHRFVVVEGNTTREIFASDMKSFVNYRFPGVFFYAISDGNAVIPSDSKVIYKNVAFSSITVEKFNGKLFCLETQTGNFLVRHKDLIYFSGNSAGCVVIVWETKEQKEVLRKLFAKLDELARQKIQHLKLTVFN